MKHSHAYRHSERSTANEESKITPTCHCDETKQPKQSSHSEPLGEESPSVIASEAKQSIHTKSHKDISAMPQYDRETNSQYDKIESTPRHCERSAESIRAESSAPQPPQPPNNGWDIIIGNPPYGADLSKEERAQYKQIYNISTSNTAQFFIVMAHRILALKGINTFIVPKSLTYVHSWKPLRDSMQDSLYLLVDCSKAFENANLEMVIYGISNNIKYHYYKNFSFKTISISNINNIHKDIIKAFDFFPSNLDSAHIKLGLKLRYIGNTLNGIHKNQRGITYQKHLLVSGKYSFIGGKEISRYKIKNTKGFTNTLANIPQQAFIKENSLLVQNIVTEKHITALLPINKEYYLLDTINQLIFENLDSRLMWAIFNSTLMNWYVSQCIFAGAKMTMHIDSPATNKIPIPKLDSTNEQIVQEIIALVDSRDSYADKKELESKIDSLVYKLYNLTDSEIKIIEGEK